MIVLLYGILIVVVLADLATHRIPNALILVTFTMSLLASLVTNGASQIMEVFPRIIAIFIISYLLYLTSALGAGDVKLMVVVSVFLELNKLIKILTISLMLFAVVGIIHMLVFGKFYQVFKSLKGRSRDQKKTIANFDLKESYMDALIRLKVVRTAKVTEFIEKIKKGKVTKLAFSPCILGAVVLVERGLIK